MPKPIQLTQGRNKTQLQDLTSSTRILTTARSEPLHHLKVYNKTLTCYGPQNTTNRMSVQTLLISGEVRFADFKYLFNEFSPMNSINMFRKRSQKLKKPSKLEYNS